MAREIDALTSSTLKHLRDRWWSESFTDFLRETLEPRAGDRILDVGCGVGTAEVRLGQLGISQVRLFAVDLIVLRVAEAVAAAHAHNIRARFAAADSCRLPFRNDAFDSTFCVAVLQHVAELTTAVRELARVTKPDGHVLVVEPDNAARYWYSSCDAGVRAFELGTRFFRALADAAGDATDLAVGPKLSTIFTGSGIKPTAVRLFPVSLARLGTPSASVWDARRESVRAAIASAPDESLRRLGSDYLRLVERYAEEAAAAGPGFVEIQNTMLFATVGRKAD